MKYKHFLFYCVVDILCVALICSGFYAIKSYQNSRPDDGAGDTSFFTISNPNKNPGGTSGGDISGADSSGGQGNVSDVSEEPIEPTWAQKFADKFTDEVARGENSYSSPNVSVEVTKHVIGSGSKTITYFVADIYVTDIECIAAGMGGDRYKGGSEWATSFGERNDAIALINGDYYSQSATGPVVRNGVVYATSPDSYDVCVLYYSGEMKTYSAVDFDMDEAINNYAYQVWSFGPALLDAAGSPMTSFPAARPINGKNPRTAIGYIEPGHYCFVVVDGREAGYSVGMTMSELSQLMYDLGCVSAYNLDGGATSAMTFENILLNKPYEGGRRCSDFIFVRDI